MVTDLAARLMKSRITRIRLPFSKQFESETSATSATSRGVDTSEVRTELNQCNDLALHTPREQRKRNGAQIAKILWEKL